MQNKDCISVIIPTADRGQQLRKAVDSVLTQSLPPAKIIIVDNGVNEAGVKFEDARVAIVRTSPRIGPGRPRNIGVQNCDTEYIAFLDDDDWWDPLYIKYTIKKLKETEADVVVGQLKRQRADGSVRDYKMFPEEPERQRGIFFSNPGFGGQNIAIKREVFLEMGGFDERMPASEDRDLAARLIIAGKKIVCEPNAVAVLCDHGGSRVSHNIIRGNWMFICKHWKHMRFSERAKALKTLVKRELLHINQV